MLGLSQLLGGIGLALTPAGGLARLADWLVRNELAEDRADPVALWMQHAGQTLSASEGAFFAVYLCLHGVLNLGLVLALLARLRWAYPVSIAVLIGFVAYQMYNFSQDGSVTMILLSVIDIVVIWLIWREYRAVRAHPA